MKKNKRGEILMKKDIKFSALLYCQYIERALFDDDTEKESIENMVQKLNDAINAIYKED